jgi:uncharacterized protein (UPF0261 family)
VAGTFDTKGAELLYLAEKLRALGHEVMTVDLSTASHASPADVKPRSVAACHPEGEAAVFSGDRGRSVSAMAEAFANWISAQKNVGGLISAGGSGGTTLATAGMRRLPIGVPKVMVSTMASGNTASYVGPADIMMLYAVTDVQGLNAISRNVLGNAAHALSGMMKGRAGLSAEIAALKAKPALGITMFGVTTPCVQQVVMALEKDYECLVFHATGTGGRSMEKLADSGFLSALLDLTTTEVADMIVGGILAADEDRFGSAIRTRIPYVGSVGAMDMVNFGPRNSVPEKFAGRRFVVHNENVTLMRTTAEECRTVGKWIGERLNLMEGEVRFLLPEKGVSSLDREGQPFDDPEADEALFTALEETARQTPRRKVIRINANINDQAFAEAVVANFAEIAKT